MRNRTETGTTEKQTTWTLRGLAIILVGAGSTFLYAGIPNQVALLAIGACLTLAGIFLILAR